MTVSDLTGRGAGFGAVAALATAVIMGAADCGLCALRTTFGISGPSEEKRTQAASIAIAQLPINTEDRVRSPMSRRIPESRRIACTRSARRADLASGIAGWAYG